MKIITGFLILKAAPTPKQTLLPIKPSCPNILIFFECIDNEPPIPKVHPVFFPKNSSTRFFKLPLKEIYIE